uniref:Protein kinase domain-containing protein n=1 Tax=Dunaliella tertiolecta TaxID=3047 RepID=A0A7S3R8X6_DUNTE
MRLACTAATTLQLLLCCGSILDAASSAVSVVSSGEEFVENLAFVNLCSKSILLNPSARLSGLLSHAMFFLPRSRSTQNNDRIGSSVYISRREFLGILYWLALDLSPFADIQDGWAKNVLKYAPQTHAIVRSMDEHSISIEYMELAGGIDRNVTYRSTSNPHDPFGIALPEFGGSLMPHRLCSPDGNSTGPLLTDIQVQTANASAFPTWIVTSSTEFLERLKVFSDHAFADSQGHPALEDRPVQMVFILKDISLALENIVLWRRTFLLSDTLLHGPLSSHRPILDFAGNEGVLSLGARSTLFIRNIVLSGLKPVAIFSRDGTSKVEAKTCLKLVAIDRRERQIVQVAAVTFQVPKDEFLALLSAVSRGAHWQDSTSAAVPLLQDISVFEPEEHDRSQLLLAKYKGWDVEGSDVTFVPSDPLTDQEYQEFLESDKGDEDNVAPGIGIAMGLGIPMIIESLYLLAVAWRRNRNNSAHSMEDTSVHKAIKTEAGPVSVSMESSSKQELLEMKELPGSACKQRRGTQEVSEPQSGPSQSFTTPHTSQEEPAETLCMPATTPHMSEDDQPTNLHEESSNVTKPAETLCMPATPMHMSEGNPTIYLGEESTKTTKPMAAAPQQSALSLSGSIEEIELNESDLVRAMESSALIQKIVDDQKALVAPHHGFNSLLRQEVESLQKASAYDDALRLEVIIGRGAWGAVYKGSWKGLTVAVKTVLFTARADAGNKPIPIEARAVMEAAVCLSLSHPNIVSTYHYDIKQVSHNESGDKKSLHVEGSADMLEDWKLFLVLEYCHCNLGVGMHTGLFGRNQPIFEKVIHVLLDVARGALYLHEHHIIHGDLKPENILLKADSSSPVGLRAKITDFGLSTNLGPTATHASNFRQGTPYYCSPEVANDGRATKASDVFSFGILMSELCSGIPPFKKVGDNDYILNPCFPSFPPPVPGAFKNLALRCMEFSTSARPNFEEIVSCLQVIQREYESTG